MNIWLVVVGEPLSIKGEARLRRVGILADYLVNQNHIVHIFTSSFDHYQKIQLVKKDEVITIKDNYYIHIAYALGYQKNVSLKRIIHHKIAAYKINEMMNQETKPDIILVCNNPFEPVKVAVNYGIKKNVPVIVDIRDLWPEIFVEAVSFKLKPLIIPYKKCSEITFGHILKKAYALIGLSPLFLEYGLKLAHRQKNSFDTVIPIGYPRFDYIPSETAFKSYLQPYGLKQTDFIIAFTGNFGRQFAFNAIIEASQLLTEYKDIKFVLCGTGENIDFVRTNCQDNVIFLGWVEKDAIITLLSYAQLGIAPYINSINFRSNTPNKFGEYLSSGLPVLVSVTGSMDQLLTAYQCGYYYQNGKHLTKLILNYYQNQALLLEQRRNARTLFSQMFDGEKVTKALADHLLKVAKEFHH